MKTIQTFGKCILTGEHSVIRGGKAIALPLKSRKLSLQYGDDIQTSKTDLQSHLDSTLSLAAKKIGFKLNEIVRVESNIPSRAGLGSSAALSVAITRYLATKHSFKAEEFFPFALELENIFHGTSSGIDIAAVLAEHPVLFQNGKAEKIPFDWKPYLYISDTLHRSSTKECVEKVVALGEKEIDVKMSLATELAMEALQKKNINLLANSLQEAHDCFSSWGLISPEIATQINDLKKMGALAVKPTGSGNGGFLLSLWEKPIMNERLIPLWEDF